MGALANDQVGEFVNKHFVSTYVKVGTFLLVNGQKQGGNVATYFCLPDGSVLHAIAGPVDANTMLFEAKWVFQVHQRASFESGGDRNKYKEVLLKAHAERADREYGVDRRSITRLHNLGSQGTNADGGSFKTINDEITMAKFKVLESQNHRIENRGKVHLLLALFPMVKVEDVYKYVFEQILKEKVSALPVVEN